MKTRVPFCEQLRDLMAKSHLAKGVSGLALCVRGFQFSVFSFEKTVIVFKKRVLAMWKNCKPVWKQSAGCWGASRSPVFESVNERPVLLLLLVGWCGVGLWASKRWLGLEVL